MRLIFGLKKTQKGAFLSLEGKNLVFLSKVYTIVHDRFFNQNQCGIDWDTMDILFKTI